jgi:hypothetical protein
MQNDPFATLIVLFTLGIFLIKIGVDSIVLLPNKNSLINFIAVMLGITLVAFSICFFIAIQFPKTFDY